MLAIIELVHQHRINSNILSPMTHIGYRNIIFHKNFMFLIEKQNLFSPTLLMTTARATHSNYLHIVQAENSLIFYLLYVFVSIQLGLHREQIAGNLSHSQAMQKATSRISSVK